MSEPYIGEIKMFGGSFAPRNYALCNGQIMSIQQNSALFAILGTTYGGNGTTTFGLPDFRGRVPMHWGQGPGLGSYVLGEVAGVESVTLLSTQMPAHTHTAQISVGCNADDATLGNPAGAVLAIPNASSGAVNAYTPSSAGTSGTIAGVNSTINIAGGSQPHENHQPYLVVTFIIALVGIFPSRN